MLKQIGTFFFNRQAFFSFLGSRSWSLWHIKNRSFLYVFSQRRRCPWDFGQVSKGFSFNSIFFLVPGLATGVFTCLQQAVRTRFGVKLAPRFSRSLYLLSTLRVVFFFFYSFWLCHSCIYFYFFLISFVW